MEDLKSKEGEVTGKDARSPDKTKSMAALIVGKLSPPAAADAGAEDTAVAMDTACQEMMSALQSNDVASFKSALDAYLDLR